MLHVKYIKHSVCLFFSEFSSNFFDLFLVTFRQPIRSYNPYLGDVTEGYGLRGLRLYYCCNKRHATTAGADGKPLKGRYSDVLLLNPSQTTVPEVRNGSTSPLHLLPT